MKITIITSAYNAEKTIERTMYSVQEQTYSDYEYLIVNHGSTDATENILQREAAADKRIRILNMKQNNGYIGKALNMALMEASGEYITFLDADDYYEKEYLEKMIGRMGGNEFDFAVCGFNRVAEDGKLIREDTIPQNMMLRTKQDYNQFLMLMNNCSLGYLYVWWNKVYRLKYLKKKRFLFPEDMKVHADSVFNAWLFLEHPKVCCISDNLVNWTCREGSVSYGNYQKGYYKEALRSTKMYEKLFEEGISDIEEYKKACRHLVLSIAHLQRIYHYQAERKEVLRELDEWVNDPYYKKLIGQADMQDFVEQFSKEFKTHDERG